MKKLIIIEDDLELAEILREFLELNNYSVTICNDPFSGMDALQASDANFDALILDLTLPGMDGLDVCRKIRAISQIPIIISSARSDIGDKIEAFDVGANDYLPKPYNPRELLARLQSHIRRAQPTPLAPPTTAQGEFLVDEFRHEILKNGVPLDLTRAEYEVLKYMISMNGGTVSREEIIINTSAIDIDAGAKSVDVLISRLRSKIGDDAKNPRYIKSVRGVGYRFYQNGVGGGFVGNVGEGLLNASVNAAVSKKFGPNGFAGVDIGQYGGVSGLNSMAAREFGGGANSNLGGGAGANSGANSNFRGGGSGSRGRNYNQNYGNQNQGAGGYGGYGAGGNFGGGYGAGGNYGGYGAGNYGNAPQGYGANYGQNYGRGAPQNYGQNYAPNAPQNYPQNPQNYGQNYPQNQGYGGQNYSQNPQNYAPNYQNYAPQGDLADGYGAGSFGANGANGAGANFGANGAGGFSPYDNLNFFRDLSAAQSHLASAFYSLRSQVFSTPDELQSAISQNFAEQQKQAALAAMQETFGGANSNLAGEAQGGAVAQMQNGQGGGAAFGGANFGDGANLNGANLGGANLGAANFGSGAPLAPDALAQGALGENRAATAQELAEHSLSSTAAALQSEQDSQKNKFDFKLKNSIDGFSISFNKDEKKDGEE